jgi:hypothetical protein
MDQEIRIPYKPLSQIVHFEKNIVALTNDGDLFVNLKGKWVQFPDIPMGGAVQTVNVVNGLLLISLKDGSIWFRKDKKWTEIKGIPEASGERLY